MDVGSIFAGKTRVKADRMSASARTKRITIQTCGKVAKGVRCDQEAAISKGSRHRCLDHI